MPRVDLDLLPRFAGPDAAEPFGGPLGSYEGRAVSKAFGLHRVGVNVETLQPGAASSHRHWHSHVDELVVVLNGVLALVEQDAVSEMSAGDVAVFAAGVPNGHRLENRGDAPATFLVASSQDREDMCHYADLDLVVHPGGALRRRDGSVAEP